MRERERERERERRRRQEKTGERGARIFQGKFC
jgi:hypothetical protein